MYKSKPKILSIFIVSLFIISLIYFDPSLNNKKIPDLVIHDKPILPDPDNKYDENIDYEDDSSTTPIKKVENPGNYKTFAFFSGGGTEQGLGLIADPEREEQIYWGDSRENVIEWETYDDIKDDAYLAKELYWRALSTASHTWPTQANVWFHMHEQNYPDEPSKMFSPVFTEEWNISGRVHYLTYLETSSFSETITIDVRLSIHLFNPADQSTSLITSTTFIVPTLFSMTQRTYFSDIATSVLIPAGYRLKYDIELRFSSIPTTGSVLMFTGYPVGGGGSMTWDITDGIYSNSYTVLNRTRMAGIQLYMWKNYFPSIQIFNAVNETVYSSARDITIDVTDGSTSSFRWNGDPVWEPIVNSTLTSLPLEHGWNTLEVKASDPIYNNTVVELYQFGYDESPDNVVLENAISNSVIAGDFELQFSVYNITSATFEWDNNGSSFSFEYPYTITGEQFSGIHNLTIISTDFYTIESFYYEFIFDSTAPTFLLKSPGDNSFQAPGKSINIEINDSAGVDIVSYHWDVEAETVWTPLSGILYRTYLPSAGGWHNLYVTANDTHGNQNTSSYSFFTDPTILNVELTNMIDDSYYVGGNDVEVTITSSNETIKYQWNNGVWKDKLDAEWANEVLTLRNGEGLPSTLGVHILKIRTGDISNNEETFTFTFTIDQQAPEYDTTVLNYSNLRYRGYETLTFTVTDNFTLSPEIILLISVDGGFYQSMLFPFMLPLYSFFDGNHSIVIYVWDIAGNVNVTTIYVIVDNTAPDIGYLIPELINYIHIDGNRYVPADALVEVTLTDDDGLIFSYYSINGSAYVPFDSNFTLGYDEGLLPVTILANDSLGNWDDYTFYLILDNSPPTLGLLFPFNYTSEINDLTPLQFNTQDLSDKTISLVEYEWDINPGFFKEVYPNPNGDFDFALTSGLQVIYELMGMEYAILKFHLEDIVGNMDIIEYNFNLDYTSPNDTFYIFNEITSKFELVSQFYYVKGNTEIIYNDAENEDLIKLEYFWDGNTSEGSVITLLNGTNPYSWIINVPSIDGEHNLTVKLYDDAGEGFYPNIRTETYFLKVDDISINFINPDGFSDDNHYHTTILYKDSFNFRINVSDSGDGLPLDNVDITYHYDSTYNFSIEIFQIDNITYDFTITAYNVTGGLETAIEFSISQYADHKDLIVIHLAVDKREGTLLILEGGHNDLLYDSTAEFTLQLNDNLNVSTQKILIVTVNGTSVPFVYFAENGTATISLFIPDFAIGKGNYTFEIYVESPEYYYTLIDSSIIAINVQPIPLVLTLSVSNTTIIIDTQVIVTALVTFLNGTPVSESIPINFSIYIVYKQTTEGVNALPSNYAEVLNEIEYTNPLGEAILTFTLSEDIDFIAIEASYGGQNNKYDEVKFEFEEYIITILPPETGLPQHLLIIIIVGCVILMGIISFVVYKVTKSKPFEDLMKNITDEEIALKYSILSPGIVLSIFDQRKGPITLVLNHSLDIDRYLGRMQIGKENFLLKIADQAYSSLGFEEHTDDRRVGSIVLPSEKMIGFLQGVQLKNPQARGGFENLSLIVLADREYGNLLLNYQEYLYPKIDELVIALKEKKTLKEVEEIMIEIRKTSVIIILTAQQVEKIQENGNNN